MYTDEDDIDPIEYIKFQLQEEIKDLKPKFEIPKVYFEKLDPTLAENALNESAELTEAQFLEVFSTYRLGLQETQVKLHEKVLKNYGNFMEGLSQIDEFSRTIKETKNLCQKGRMSLKKGQDTIIKGSLQVIHRHRRLENIEQMLKAMLGIRELLKSTKDIETLIDQKDYPEAIHAIISTKHKLNSGTFCQYKALKDMSNNLSARFDHIQKKVEGSLKAICNQFDGTLYEKTLTAHKLLGKQEFNLRIKNIFESLVKHKLQQTARSFAYKRNHEVEKLSKMRFTDLCNFIESEDVLSCCIQSFAALADIMNTYHCIINWHVTYNQKKEKDFDFTDELNYLNNYKIEIWGIMQHKMSMLLKCMTFSAFKLDQFLQVFHGVSMFCELGEEFSGSDSHTLRKTLTQQSQQFFSRYHRIHVLDYLKQIIENENWGRIDYNFQFSELNIRNADTSIYAAFSKKVKNFLRNTDAGHDNPFREAAKLGSFKELKEKVEDNQSFRSSMVQEDEEEDEEEEEEVLDVNVKAAEFFGSPIAPKKKKKISSKYVITNSCLVVIKQISVFMHAMEILQPIAIDVFQSFTSIFQFYIYTVFSFFATRDPTKPCFPESDGHIPKPLRHDFALVRKKLDSYHQSVTTAQSHVVPLDVKNLAKDGQLEQFPLPRNHTVFRLLQEKSNGILFKSTAVESMLFLLDIVNFVNLRMISLLPKNKSHLVDSFTQQVTSMALTVRGIVYQRHLSTELQIDTLASKISSCKYSLKEPPEQSSPFVNSILKNTQAFFSIITEMDDLPAATPKELWDHATRMIMGSLIEGWSRVKKCNQQGLNLMMRDLRSIQAGLTEITTMPIHSQEKANDYVLAFYKSSTEFVEWLSTKPNFSRKQLEAIVQNGIMSEQIKKKEKAEITRKIGELFNDTTQKRNQPSFIQRFNLKQ